LVIGRRSGSMIAGGRNSTRPLWMVTSQPCRCTCWWWRRHTRQQFATEVSPPSAQCTAWCRHTGRVADHSPEKCTRRRGPPRRGGCRAGRCAGHGRRPAAHRDERIGAALWHGAGVGLAFAGPTVSSQSLDGARTILPCSASDQPASARRPSRRCRSRSSPGWREPIWVLDGLGSIR
jgi:hypothetical protein